MICRAVPGAALSLVVGWQTLVLASSSQAWVLRNRSDFQEAKLDGVALGPDGSFRLSASVSTLLDAAQPNMWCVLRDRKGRLLAGGGNDGKVFTISGDGGADSKVLFDAQELEVHALAADSKGRLFAATSPRGAVYMITEEGLGVIVFDPEDTYIWAMAVDDQDRLFVATGQRGRVYRVDRPTSPNAAGTVVLDGREDHIRSLVRGPDGFLYAGSDQNGIVYRIGPDGTPSVLYDSPMREIASLLVIEGSAGAVRVYAAALAPSPRAKSSGSQAGQGGVTRIRVTPDEGGGEQEGPPAGEEEPEPQQQQQRQQQPRPAAAESYVGAVYSISADGYARKIWESREALPLSLAPAPPSARGSAGASAGILVGTGNDGRVLLLEDSGEATDFVTVPSQQINALLDDGEGGLVAAASNLGQVVRIRPGAARQGTITSKALDAGFTSTWGALSWDADLPAGTGVAFQVRTGNTEEPDDSWSDWSREYAERQATIIERPRARYLQWKAILKNGSASRSPVLRNIRISYLQDNMPPEIASVEVLSPGVVLASAAERGGESSEGSPAARRAQNQARRSFEKGRRSASWKAEDANDDAMRYDVYFKAEDETLWKPLGRDLEEEYLSWDATAMPDGVYRLRVTATDAPSNPPGSSLTGSRLSMAFDVDNTPPTVAPIEARLRSRSAEVSVTVRDSFSTIAELAYSLDASDWVPVLPDDKIADSQSETYKFRTPDLEPGEHTVTARVKDRAGNTAAAKVVLKVE